MLVVMQRPKWLSGWGKGSNLLEASTIIDIAGFKVVEASFNNKLLLFAVGTTQKSQRALSDEGREEEHESKSEADLEWKIFYDSTVLPQFMPFDKATSLMAGIVALSSGKTSVYNKNTVYVPSGSRPSKGNTPVLLDYDIAKKIEEAKSNKTS